MFLLRGSILMFFDKLFRTNNTIAINSVPKGHVPKNTPAKNNFWGVATRAPPGRPKTMLFFVCVFPLRSPDCVGRFARPLAQKLGSEVPSEPIRYNFSSLTPKYANLKKIEIFDQIWVHVLFAGHLPLFYRIGSSHILYLL